MNNCVYSLYNRGGGTALSFENTDILMNAMVVCNRNQDPAIYDAKSQFYSKTPGNEDDEDGENSSTVVKSHNKALKFKDVARQQILDAATSRDAVSSSEDEDDDFYEVNADDYTPAIC